MQRGQIKLYKIIYGIESTEWNIQHQLSHITQTKGYSLKRWNLKMKSRNICLHNEELLYHGTLCQKAVLLLGGLNTNKIKLN